MKKNKADTRGGYVHPQPPHIDPKGGVYPSKQKGITLRDEFAKAAMQGALSHNSEVYDKHKFAGWCYELADAMLEARNA